MKMWKIALLVLALAAVSCDKEGFRLPNTDPEPTPNPTPVPIDGKQGVLSFEAWNLGVALEQEVSLDEHPMSRAEVATEDATGNYVVRVINSRGEEVYRDTYANTKGLRIDLPLGIYTVSAECPNHENVAGAAWNAPVYYGRTNVAIIESDEVVSINPIVCRLDNVKTTVEVAADLMGLFKPDEGNDKTVIEVEMGGSALVYGRGDLVNETSEGKKGYFHSAEEENTLNITLIGQYNKDPEALHPIYTPVTWNQTIPAVKHGQWRKIRISMLHQGDGSLDLQLSVETWVYDERINVDINRFSVAFTQEEEWSENMGQDEDPGDGDGEPGDGEPIAGPSVVWAGGAFDVVHNVADTGVVVIDVTSTTGLTGLKVMIGGALSQAIGLTELDLANPGTDGEFLASLGLPILDQVVGQTALQVDISEFIPLLAGFEGETNFRLIVTDANGTTERTIRFQA